MASFATNNEHTNYARLCRAVVDLCTQLLRDLLYRQVPSPANLKNKIRRCPDVRSAGLKPDQWTCINNTATTGSYREFDITLLYQVIRLLSVQDLRDELRSNINPRKRNRNQNQIMSAVQGCPALASDPATALGTSELAEIKNADNVGSFDQCKDILLWKLFKHLCPSPNPNFVHPTEPWGSSNMSDPSKITLGDDIERIRLIRNTVYGHVSTTAISDAEFDIQWAILEDIMARMNHQLGGHYKEELDYVKVTCMDDALEKSFCDEINKLSTAEKELHKKMQKVGDDVASVSSTVTQLEATVSKIKTKAELEIDIVERTVDQKLEQTRSQFHEIMETETTKLQEDVEKLKSECEEDRQNTSTSLADVKETLSDVLDQQIQNTVEQKFEEARSQFHEEMETETKMLQSVVEKLKIECEEDKEITSTSLTDLEESFSQRMEAVNSKLTQVEEGTKMKLKDNSKGQKGQKLSLKERTSLMIDQHRDDKTFVVTEAVNKGIEMLTDHGMLIYSGLPGDGKTKNALEIMAHFRESNPDWLFLKLDDVRMWSDIHPDVNSVILFDDCLGSTNTDLGLINDGNRYWPSIHACVEKGKVKVIMTIRKNLLVKNLTKLEKYKVFSEEHTVDLTFEENRLTEDDKRNILQRHFDSNAISISQKENYHSVDDVTPVKIDDTTVYYIVRTDPLIGFPQTCFLFSSIRKYTRLGVRFFRNPTQGLIDEIGSLVEQDLNGKLQYCIMSYMLLKGGGIDFNNLDSDMFAEVFKAVKISDTPTKRELNTAKKCLTDKYITKTYENDVFEFKHQTILESVALCFYNDNPSLLLQLCNENFLEEFIRPQNYNESEGEIVLKLKEDEYKYVFPRFLYSLHGKLEPGKSKYWWVSHSILDDVQFVNGMMDLVKADLLYKQMIQNSNRGKYSMFYFACMYGKTYLVGGLYNLCCVDMCIDEDCLNAAYGKGHTDTVIWLLDNKVGLEPITNVLRRAPTDLLTFMIKHPSITLNDLTNVLDECDLIIDHETVANVLNRWPDMEQIYVLKILYNLFRFDSIEAIDVVIKKRPDVITQEVITDGFRLACIGGHIDTMNFYLNVNHENINCKMIPLLQNYENLTNLHIAAFMGQFDVCVKLIELHVGLCVTDRTAYGLSILQFAIWGYACRRLSSSLIRSKSTLLAQYYKQSKRRGRSIDLSNIKTLISFLIEHNDVDKTDLDKPVDDYNRTLVHHCVVHNDLSIIELLCKIYPSVLYVSDSFNHKPIHLAILLGRSEIFQILYSMNTDTDALDSYISRGRQYAGTVFDFFSSTPEFLDGVNLTVDFSFGKSYEYASIATTVQDSVDSQQLAST